MSGTQFDRLLTQAEGCTCMRMKKESYQVIVIGAGPAGLMGAATASQAGVAVLVVDANPGPGRKLSVCGGGKGNFTNREVDARKHYISENPRFAISALSQFTNYDMLDWMDKHGIPWEERDHGRLFCASSARAIGDALLRDAQENGVQFRFNSPVESIEKTDDGFLVTANAAELVAEHIVVATGGMSYPQLGSTDFGYRIATQFGLGVTSITPGLAPLLYGEREKAVFGELTGQSLSVVARIDKQVFDDQLLFTHQGVSGPAVLQLSNYWRPGKAIAFDLMPGARVEELVASARSSNPKQRISGVLHTHFSKRMVSCFLGQAGVADKAVAQLSKADVAAIAGFVHNWTWIPAGVGEHKVAEATVGGVCTSGLSSKTLEVKTVPGLYFIGEVLDITGQLGGYNLQWAWSSGYAAGIALLGLY